MALDKDRLGDAIVDTLKTNNVNIDGVSETELRVVWKLIADEIIKEFIANAQVSVTTPGVQAGGSTLPGTGGINA